MDARLIALLRVAHVIAASFWLGAMLMNAGFLIPAVRASGPSGGAVMAQLVQVRRLPRYINAAVLVAILSGGVLFWWTSAGLSPVWMSTLHGRTMTVAAVLALFAAATGQFVNAPTAARLGRLAAQAAGGPPSAEVTAERERLQRRLFRATQAAAAMVTLAAAGMAAARYL